MTDYFIFQYEDDVSFTKKQTVTVIFCHLAEIENSNILSEEINRFFRHNSLSEKLVVIVPDYLSDKSLDHFFANRQITFQRLPGLSNNYLDACLSVYKFQRNGSLEIIYGTGARNKIKFRDSLFRNGLTQIFKNNGGLVEATSDHHFVFPSKKHCSKFIRTGNVLINSCEIYFMTLQILNRVISAKTIYCDTSSINVLPYAAFDLLHRFSEPFQAPAVHSFKSYELFEQNNARFGDEAFILISSSTSGNIIDRILEKKLAAREQINVIYFLGPDKKFLNHASNIICNLTYDETSYQQGVKEFKTFENIEVCDLCRNYSRPIEIRGDVFLTIQPKIEKILIATDHAPKGLSNFVEQHRGRTEKSVILKNYYKEKDANADYEVFIDTIILFKQKSRFSHFHEKLARLIDKHIPANVNCIIYLPDEGSEILAKIVKSKIPKSISPKLIKLDKGFEKKIGKDFKSAIVVASCIVTGKKLLHISRILREFEQLSLQYFIGIFRPNNDDYAKRLKSNLSKGQNESDDRPVIHVEKFNCENNSKNSVWYNEKDFLEKIFSTINEDVSPNFYLFVRNRINVLLANKRSIGLSNDVFLKTYVNDKLYLRKNFAFWNFTYKEKEVFQSEVFFTISSIINNLENIKLSDVASLKQSNYSRNILSPDNFQRYNDGIIQACILRAGKPIFFAYDLDESTSLGMKIFLLSLIEQYDTEHGEALLEFLLAIALRRLRLKKNDLKEVLIKAISCPNEIIAGFATCVKEYLEMA